MWFTQEASGFHGEGPTENIENLNWKDLSTVCLLYQLLDTLLKPLIYAD